MRDCTLVPTSTASAASTGAVKNLGQPMPVVRRIFERDDVRMFSKPIDHVDRDVMVRRHRNVVEHQRQRDTIGKLEEIIFDLGVVIG